MMGTIYIFMFTFLIVQVSCEQKNSLTFVIDDTSSMYDEIYQVKSAAKSIVDIVLNEKASQIHDIVVVTFNDPGVKFRHRTRNEVELKHVLDSINVHGGGDCPELSLTGIQLALGKSQPGSYLFVFTDASALDYRKFNDVKALCQEKQSQIVFVLTGDCGDLAAEDSQVYYRIAAASNGQVFRISKGEVGQVLEYVKETIKGDKTVITSIVVPPGTWSIVHFNIDDKTEYALVSASGSNVQLKVLDHYNRDVSGIDVIWTRNVKALKLVKLRPGAYKAKVRGSSDVNVMVFGRTDFNFKFGFSNNVQNSLKYTEAQPIQDIETRLIISVKDDEHSVNIENVEILDMNENVIKRLPLKHVKGNVYTTEKFLPPNSMFKVAVTAKARSTGKPIRRIANTPVEPIKPITVAPEISDTEKFLKAEEGETVDIYCSILKGKPKPRVKWYFKQRGAPRFELMQGKTDEILRMSNVEVGNTGEYQCVAKNTVGQATHVVTLEVYALPAFEKSPSVLEVRQSANVDISCKVVKGNPIPAITWQFKSSGGEFHDIGSIGEHLRIVNVQLSNSGFYKCRAKNSVGASEKVTQVVVLEPPAFETSPSILEVRQSANVDIPCKVVKGNPIPAITWQFKSSDGEVHDLGNVGEHLIIVNAQLRNSGFYKCRAKNSIGVSEKVIQVVVLGPPAFEKSPSILEVRQSANVDIPCKVVKGNPIPAITWQFKSSGGEFHDIDSIGEHLRIVNVQLRNSGFYKCRAKNSVGASEKVTQVVVLGPPAFEKSPSILEVRQSANVDIPCKVVKGNPIPAITWQFKSSGGEFHDIDSIGEHLRIVNVQFRNSGFYKCRAKNSVGASEKVTQVVVLGPPAFEKSPSILEVRQSANVDIPCKVVKGNPIPAITWQFKSSDGEVHDLENVGEHLIVVNAQLRNSGFYKCRAENNIGASEKVTQIVVLVKPEFEETPAEITGMLNAPVTIKCKLREGNPPPRITWSFQVSGSGTFTTLRNSGEELTLPAAQLKDSGEYRCVAENRAGRDEKTTLVTVLAAPEIERSEPSILKVKENASVSIACRVAKGFPEPTITWLNQDGKSMEHAVVSNASAKYLLLDNIQLPQAGHYKCVAQNSVGTANKDVQVIVEAPARIVFIPPNSRFYEGVEGDLVMRLPCTAVGYPVPIVSWTVDKVAVGKDKSTPLYVEEGVLYLKNPDESHSSNNSHTYECYAENSFGNDKQSYDVVVSKYADYNDPGEIYGEIKKPYDLKCPLPYTDPDSVRWFYNSIYMNKTGPSLHFEEASQENNGNYTCRVSDFKGATSFTVELKFGRAPWSARLVYNEDWNGEETDIICKAQQIIPDGKYEWFYHGEKVKEADAHELELTLMGWGQYVCRVTNPLGSLNITYNIHARDCIIDQSSSKTKNSPLVLDMSLTWPRFPKQQEYHIIPTSEKLTLICQDESPKNESDSKTNSNSFTKLPNTKSIIATCDHEDMFLVDGVSYKFSELDCKEELQSSVVAAKECLGSDTMMMNVGFNVNGFLNVYKSCMDTKRNVVLYTELITTSQSEYDDSAKSPSTKPCENVADCCYESVQLVNAADVSAGPSETATSRKPLNTVSYCRPNSNTTTSWHDIEQQLRAESSRSSLIVWSGAVNYTTVDKLLVPQYLWKVVKDLDNEKIMAIVHSNEQEPSTSLCENVCEESSWFEPNGPRTYCCRLDEFRRVFNLPIDF